MANYFIEPVMLGTNHQVYWQTTENSFILSKMRSHAVKFTIQ